MRNIDLFLTEPQERFVFSTAAHPGMCAGYGAGKSQAGVIRILLKAIQYPGLAFAFVEPTYDLVRLIAWPRFEQILTEWGVRFSLNKSESVMVLENGSRIIFRSADNPARLIGFEVADVLIDEADLLKQDVAAEVWVKLLGRARQKKPDKEQNTVACVSTPEGFRWMYHAYERDKRPGYELIRAPTASNPYLPAGYIDSLKRSYPAQLIAAYLEGQFVNLMAGAVYPDFGREANHTPETIQPGEELHIGQDFNVYNCTSIVGVIRFGVPKILGELVKMRDTPHVIETIKQKYPGHRINIYPDASGQSNKTVNATESDILLLKRAGFIVHVPSRNPFVKERVMAVNGLICNALGERKLLVNTLACPTLTECLEQQIYDDNGEPDKSDGKDHAPDALGYFLHFRWPIVKPTSTKFTTVPHMAR